VLLICRVRVQGCTPGTSISCIFSLWERLLALFNTSSLPYLQSTPLPYLGVATTKSAGLMFIPAAIQISTKALRSWVLSHNISCLYQTPATLLYMILKIKNEFIISKRPLVKLTMSKSTCPKWHFEQLDWIATFTVAQLSLRIWIFFLWPCKWNQLNETLSI